MNPVVHTLAEPATPALPRLDAAAPLLRAAAPKSSDTGSRAALPRASHSKSPCPLPPTLRGLDDPPSYSTRID
jgi:hypothetical protein